MSHSLKSDCLHCDVVCIGAGKELRFNDRPGGAWFLQYGVFRDWSVDHTEAVGVAKVSLIGVRKRSLDHSVQQLMEQCGWRGASEIEPLRPKPFSS